MRKSNVQSISEILKEVFKELRIDKKLKETQLINSWSEIVGTFIGKKTKNIYIKNRVLYISIESSVIRNELLLISESLITRLNNHCGEEVINRIVFR